jgi:hypothetical protein
MAQKSLEDIIYDRLIDIIQNGAKDNDLRDAYDVFMSDRNYNNTDMKALFEHCVKMVELDWETCRNDREEDKLIDTSAEEAVAQGIAIWVLSDKKLANAIDNDRVWKDLQASANDWDRVEADYERATRGGRDRDRDRGDRDRDERGGRGGRDSRASRNTGIGYQQSRPPTSSNRDRDERGGRSRGRDDNTRMTGGFGAGRSQPRETARNAEAPQQRDTRNSSPLARAPRQQENREVEQESRLHRHQEHVEDVIENNAGPDFSLPRPYDSFWDNNENWQLAHVSDLTWMWSPSQQFCRSYDPDQEVRFLVKGEDGNVREEFLPMTDDLNFAAHEIKALKRPNDERRTRTGVGAVAGEISLPGNDLDTVDLDKLSGQVEEARRTLITQLDLNSVELEPNQVVAATIRDGLIRATTLRLQTGKDIASAQNMIVEILPSTGKGTHELESLSNLIGSDGGLDVLQKRLQGLRGKVDESVLDHINRHYTDEVNHSLKYAFGFGGKLAIDSFIDDFTGLLTVMTKHRNAGFTAQYLTRTRNLVPTLVVIKEDDGRKDIIEAQDLLPEAEEDSAAYIAYRENVVVLLKPSASVSVNIDLEAFGMVDADPRVAVGTGAGADPELRDVLNGLYLIARKSSAPGRVHVVTADNIILELVGIAGARDVVGVRRV